jgi:four helix bundle protein
MTTTGRVTTDFKFRNQIRNSARSAPSNIAEGFKRFDPPEFAHLLKIALGSLAETQDHLLHGRDEKYFPDDQFTEAWRLSCRALKAGHRLHEYLRNCPKKGNLRRRINPDGTRTNPD